MLRNISIAIYCGLALATTGCLAGAALQLVPEVAQLATGAGALGASAVHGDDKLDQQSDAPGAACDDIKASAPLVIELRTAASAPLSFRNLILVTPHKKTPYWEAQGDWRAGSDLARMGFDPPLEKLLPAGPQSYIVYAPLQPRDEREQGQLENLMVAFGADVGTFQSQQRTFDYTIVTRLPCFPVPQ
ncbi:MAG TPA: hypothetical protein VNE82_17085 [Candidatus Binataceae bacterium]|nr:hypothetical protein [Candidatus Binataceae bacterium]